MQGITLREASTPRPMPTTRGNNLACFRRAETCRGFFLVPGSSSGGSHLMEKNLHLVSRSVHQQLFSIGRQLREANHIILLIMLSVA